MPRYIDISRTITPEAVVYPGDPPLEQRSLSQIGTESSFNLTELHWTTHFLTHVDAPLHFVKDGKSIDELPIGRFFGDAVVIEVEGDAVLPGHIDDHVRGKRVLFKTANSSRWHASEYDESHVYVSAEAAQKLVEYETVLVGIDYLSIDRYGDETYPAHRTLLGAGIPILEGVDLSAVVPGLYTLVALPLRIFKGDGSPVRAMLISE